MSSYNVSLLWEWLIFYLEWDFHLPSRHRQTTLNIPGWVQSHTHHIWQKYNQPPVCMQIEHFEFPIFTPKVSNLNKSHLDDCCQWDNIATQKKTVLQYHTWEETERSVGNNEGKRRKGGPATDTVRCNDNQTYLIHYAPLLYIYIHFTGLLDYNYLCINASIILMLHLVKVVPILVTLCTAYSLCNSKQILRVLSYFNL